MCRTVCNGRFRNDNHVRRMRSDVTYGQLADRQKSVHRTVRLVCLPGLTPHEAKQVPKGKRLALFAEAYAKDESPRSQTCANLTRGSERK